MVVQITRDDCQAVAVFLRSARSRGAAVATTTHPPTLKSLRKQLSCSLPVHEHRTV
ncbi:hypothetical protein C7S14_2487 [Burkholderia cepacia]|nr:hypothetical protein C7S14_2487 [Burkholderia cepacia]